MNWGTSHFFGGFEWQTAERIGTRRRSHHAAPRVHDHAPQDVATRRARLTRIAHR